MARLKLPEKAYYNKCGGDSLWHLRWADVPGGPTMVCGRMIFKEARLEKEINNINPGELCHICLGAIGAEWRINQ